MRAAVAKDKRIFMSAVLGKSKLVRSAEVILLLTFHRNMPDVSFWKEVHSTDMNNRPLNNTLALVVFGLTMQSATPATTAIQTTKQHTIHLSGLDHSIKHSKVPMPYADQWLDVNSGISYTIVVQSAMGKGYFIGRDAAGNKVHHGHYAAADSLVQSMTYVEDLDTGDRVAMAAYTAHAQPVGKWERWNADGGLLSQSEYPIVLRSK